MSWDQKLDFDTYEKKFSEDLKQLYLFKEYKQLKNESTTTIEKCILYVSILYTQLLNGCRISEACDAIIQFAIDNNREQNIRARKRTKNGKGEEAQVLIIIPKSIKRLNISLNQDKINHEEIEEIENRVKCYARDHYHINTHSLRYSWIAKMGRDGVPANLISKAIRHSSIQTIMNYTSEDQADGIKRKFIEQRK